MGKCPARANYKTESTGELDGIRMHELSKEQNVNKICTFSNNYTSSKMSKPRVLIVGATGRAGATIVNALLEGGETVRNH
jgi:hypothetical protein